MSQRIRDLKGYRPDLEGKNTDPPKGKGWIVVELRGYTDHPMERPGDLYIVETLMQNLANGGSPPMHWITERTLEELKNENVPADVIGKLQPLKDKVFASEKEFDTALTQQLTGSLAQYRTKVREHVNKDPSLTKMREQVNKDPIYNRIGQIVLFKAEQLTIPLAGFKDFKLINKSLLPALLKVGQGDKGAMPPEGGSGGGARPGGNDENKHPPPTPTSDPQAEKVGRTEFVIHFLWQPPGEGESAGNPPASGGPAAPGGGVAVNL